jgi:hypothetical protein
VRISSSTAYALGVSAAVAILAGCTSSGSQSALSPSAPIEQKPQQTHQSISPTKTVLSALAMQKLNALLSPRDSKINVLTEQRRTHGGSFIKPAAKAGSLLYVSDADNGYVYIYSWFVPGFTRGTFMGQLAGPLSEPVGLCVDKKANVYVADAFGQGVWEFAHNDVIPINFLPDPGNVPISCSVDKITGNVAVANAETTGAGSGSVYVYPGGSPDWVPYYNIGSPPLNQMLFDGYDNAGNLFADGCTALPLTACTAATVQVVELPKGADEFNPPEVLQGVPLTQLQFPGQIQWDGQGNLDVGDSGPSLPGNSPAACIGEPTNGCAALYATKIGSGILKQHFVTNFIRSEQTAGTWTVGSRVVVPNLFGNLSHSGSCLTPIAPSVTCTLIYYYGLGVSPINEIDAPYYQREPYAATVSSGP